MVHFLQICFAVKSHNQKSKQLCTLFTEKICKGCMKKHLNCPEKNVNRHRILQKKTYVFMHLYGTRVKCYEAIPKHISQLFAVF